MYVHEILNPVYIPLRATNTISDGLEAMDEQGVDVVPLIDFTTGRMLGTVHREDIASEKDLEQTLFSKVRRKPLLVKADLHLADALHELQVRDEAYAIVVDEENMFSGIVFCDQMERSLSKLFNSDQEGAVVMVELSPNDYSLIDLVRIVEVEGAKILSVGVETPHADQSRFRVSMKLNTDDVSKILRVLNRYGYVITSKSETPETDEDLHDRADEFMRFLDT